MYKKVNYVVKRANGRKQSGVAVGISECSLMVELKNSLNLRPHDFVMFGEFEDVLAVFKVSKNGSEIDTLIFEEIPDEP